MRGNDVSSILKQLKDKRLAKRYRVQVATEINVRSMAGSRPFAFRTGNISKGGAFVVADETNPFSVHSMVEVTLYLGDKDHSSDTKNISFLGKVVHMRDKTGFGIKIVQIEPEEQAKLDSFVDDYLAAHPEVFDLD